MVARVALAKTAFEASVCTSKFGDATSSALSGDFDFRALMGLERNGQVLRQFKQQLAGNIVVFFQCWGHFHQHSIHQFVAGIGTVAMALIVLKGQIRECISFCIREIKLFRIAQQRF